ncbi:MAG: terpene cyclase/mutase family protein [Chitinophagaceae bacterium]|nr:terpene cyclase/mutase family protein [Chitinophagaceae bacterium]
MKSKIFPAITILCSSILLLSLLTGWMNKPVTVDPADIKRSVSKSLLILQQSSYTFTSNTKFKCASCHHNTLTSMAAGIAVQKGISLVDSLTTDRVNTIAGTVMGICNPNLINQLVAVNFIPPYMLLGLNAEKYPADFSTDISVDYIISQAKPDGSFLTESGRPPLETGEVHLTALDIRAIQLYASPAKKKLVNEMVARSKQWLEKAHPDQQQELVFQLLGMQWCGSSKDMRMKVASRIKSMQNADGGWSQLPTMKSDAYATGQSLYALYESRMAKPKDEVYQRGLDFLLKTQDQEGAWMVATRAYAIQPFVNSQFPPYDENQFISAAASNWATMALLSALPDKTKP